MTETGAQDDYREDPDFGFVISLGMKTEGFSTSYAERLVDAFMRRLKSKKIPDYARYQGLHKAPFGPLFVVWNSKSVPRHDQINWLRALYQDWYRHLYETHPFLNAQVSVAYGDLCPAHSPPFRVPSAQSEAWQRVLHLAQKFFADDCAYETRPLLSDNLSSKILFSSPPLRTLSDAITLGREESMELRLYLVEEATRERPAISSTPKDPGKEL